MSFTLRLSAFFLLLASPLPAQTTLLSGNHSIDGSLCAGQACTGSESFPSEADVKIKDVSPRLLFEDASGAANFATRDWSIDINDSTVNGASFFAVRDVDAGTVPFRIDAEVPQNALVVSTGPQVGIGTALPRAALHIARTIPTLRLDNTDQNQQWTMTVDELGWFLKTDTGGLGGGTIPFDIRHNAPDAAFTIRETGRVGIGVGSPSAQVHVSSSEGTAAIHVTNVGSIADAAREMFRMENKGGSYFTLANTSTSREWFFTHENNPQGRFMINHSDGGGVLMGLSRTGNLEVKGTIRSGGTQLTVPDYVFGPDYALRPLSEVQAFIDENSHLPEVPSAAEIKAEGLDMTQMQMTLLKKVEELTLYTLEQEKRLAAQDALLAEQAALNAALLERLNRLEAAAD